MSNETMQRALPGGRDWRRRGGEERPEGSRGSVLAVVGNPRPDSRTHALAAALAGSLANDRGMEVETVDLSAALPLPEDAEAAVSAVRRSCLIVAASPTYKATYTGLLKLFLDLLPAGVMEGRVAVPLMLAGSARHALAADLHLRPVLIELGASCPSPALVALESELERSGPGGVVSAWLDRSGRSLEGALA